MRSKSAKQVLQAILANFHTDTDRPRESILGSPDIQSLADLRNSYAGITEMRTLLPNRTTVGILAIAYVLPVLPLLASVISLRRVLSEVYGLLLK